MKTIKNKTSTPHLGKTSLFFITGPCVAESKSLCLKVGKFLHNLKKELEVEIIFKASYSKANRSAHSSYRGPGLKKGLEYLAAVKDCYGLPLLTDVHEASEIAEVSKIVDIIQIPAFLSRQTSLLETAADSGCWVNVKKGQFLAPWDMKNVSNKIKSRGNKNILITERGSSFGYNTLVVDYRGIQLMLRDGHQVVFDATHSVQMPSAAGKVSSGDRTLAPGMAYAAAAIGVKGFFFECHPTPEKAKSDGPNSIYLKDTPKVFKTIKELSKNLNY